MSILKQDITNNPQSENCRSCVVRILRICIRDKNKTNVLQDRKL